MLWSIYCMLTTTDRSHCASFLFQLFTKKKITSFYANFVFTMYNVFKKFFAHENMKKLASKVAEPAQNQRKSQLLFHKNLPQRDFSIMTLALSKWDQAYQKLQSLFILFWDIFINQGQQMPPLCHNTLCSIALICSKHSQEHCAYCQ